MKVNDLYVDQSEILNIHWLEFLFHQKKKLDSASYQKLLPDSANVIYHQPQYNRMPVVLISFAQAQAYCKWRSEFVSQTQGKKVVYRLMTPQEYREIASSLIRKNRKHYEKELAKSWELARKFPDSYRVVETAYLDQLRNRIVHLFDNVSEMTSEKGVAMGGHNANLTHLMNNLERVIHYQNPHSYLGFRCVAEYIE